MAKETKKQDKLPNSVLFFLKRLTDAVKKQMKK